MRPVALVAHPDPAQGPQRRSLHAIRRLGIPSVRLEHLRGNNCEDFPIERGGRCAVHRCNFIVVQGKVPGILQDSTPAAVSGTRLPLPQPAVSDQCGLNLVGNQKGTCTPVAALHGSITSAHECIVSLHRFHNFSSPESLTLAAREFPFCLSCLEA